MIKHHKNCQCGCRTQQKDVYNSKTIVLNSKGESAYQLWLGLHPDLDPNFNPESPWVLEYWMEYYVKGKGVDKNYIHSQSIPQKVWNISHPLNKKVSVDITDSAGTVIEGLIVINDGSTVTIEFNSPFSGEAILN